MKQQSSLVMRQGQVLTGLGEQGKRKPLEAVTVYSIKPDSWNKAVCV